ncbi:MAG: CCA tRNA nucleotidyltransferase [Candidatus Pelagibacter sp. TMED239]|nr:MAG: CCA tRNA nucleotidyltransferase [Candidatus Pelagibacter sp. TMED239]
MNSLIDKIFFRSQNLNYVNLGIKNITKNSGIEKIFSAINSFSKESEIRYVGGCLRKIIRKEKVDDIDLAVNLSPIEVCNALKKKNITFYESGIEHGTITALINNNKFEITSLRKDVVTDGRHAKVIFSKDWYEDSLRRDFSINSIYADVEGNLFDPCNGKKDLENGKIIFIGDTEKRIREDYLRILRYIRFFLNYSKHTHNPQVIKIIKRNLKGLSKISSERLLDEFKKLLISDGFFKLLKDKFSLEIINLIFSQFKNINIFKNLNNFAKKNFKNFDFIFLISLMIIDNTDNVNYFIYKFNISKKDQKRLLFLNNFNSSKITEKNLNKILYFNGRESVMDIIYFKAFKAKNVDDKMLSIIQNFKEKKIPLLPFSATLLMTKYNIPEGKELGNKLRKIEELWVDNNFEVSEKEVKKIINN